MNWSHSRHQPACFYYHRLHQCDNSHWIGNPCILCPSSPASHVRCSGILLEGTQNSYRSNSLGHYSWLNNYLRWLINETINYHALRCGCPLVSWTIQLTSTLLHRWHNAGCNYCRSLHIQCQEVLEMGPTTLSAIWEAPQDIRCIIIIVPDDMITKINHDIFMIFIHVGLYRSNISIFRYDYLKCRLIVTENNWWYIIYNCPWKTEMLDQWKYKTCKVRFTICSYHSDPRSHWPLQPQLFVSGKRTKPTECHREKATLWLHVNSQNSQI